MDINKLQQTVSDITTEMESYTDSEAVEDAIEKLDSVAKTLDDMLSKDAIDDQDYQEIMQEISESKYLIKESYNSKDDFYDDDTYYGRGSHHDMDGYGGLDDGGYADEDYGNY